MAAVLDFETKEMDMELFGPGWAFNGVTPIVCGVTDTLTMETHIYTDWQHLAQRLAHESILVAHNTPYDFGILAMLFGVDFLKHKTLICTKAMAYLYNSTLNTSLNELLYFFFKERKSNVPLAIYALRHRLFVRGFKQRPALIKLKKRRLARKKQLPEPAYAPVRTKEKKIELVKASMKWVYSNMDVMYKHCPELLNRYCMDDCVGEAKIYNLLIDKIDWYWIDLLSWCQKGLIRSRINGVRTDNKAVQHARDVCFMKESEAQKKVHELLGHELLITSPQQLAKALTKRGYKPEYKEETGNYSVDHDWLQGEFNRTEDPLLKNILLFRKYYVARNHFCDKIIKMNVLLETWDQPFGRIYPEVKLFGADASGRFSSSHPNIQQIPSNDKGDDEVGTEIGNLLRGCFVPEEGEQWYTMDWSAQEPRLQVHFSTKDGDESAAYLAAKWRQDPYMDIHMEVAKTVWPEAMSEELKNKRKHAKIINLGKSYGMGKSKLYSHHLKVPFHEGEQVWHSYNSKFPYLEKASSQAMAKFSTGPIQTLLGRNIYCPAKFYSKKLHKWVDLSYKAFNYKIQGSGADMCIFALAMAEKLGIKVLFPIHDEINLSTTSIDTAKAMKYIMEMGIDMEVPNVVEVGCGTNWAEACNNEIKL